MEGSDRKRIAYVAVCIHVGASIRVSDDTKRMLERLKWEDETFDELLVRKVQHEEPIEIGAWRARRPTVSGQG